MIGHIFTGSLMDT